MTKEYITDYGTISVRSVMIEDDNTTDLHEGIELTNEDGDIQVFQGYIDLDELSVDDVEALIEGK